MNKLLRLAPVVGLLGIVSAACAAPALTPAGQRVQVSDEKMVSSCKYLGDVQGDSGSTGGARIGAINAAAAMGATNVVFVSQSNGVITRGLPAEHPGRRHGSRVPLRLGRSAAASAPGDVAAAAGPAGSSRPVMTLTRRGKPTTSRGHGDAELRFFRSVDQGRQRGAFCGEAA